MTGAREFEERLARRLVRLPEDVGGGGGGVWGGFGVGGVGGGGGGGGGVALRRLRGDLLFVLVLRLRGVGALPLPRGGVLVVVVVVGVGGGGRGCVFFFVPLRLRVVRGGRRRSVRVGACGDRRRDGGSGGAGDGQG